MLFITPKMILRLIGTIMIIFFIILIALSIGSVGIHFEDIPRILFYGDTSTFTIIILKLRLPRIILAFLVGASLALSGCVLQGIFRNPLADPYIIGASSGASVGTAVATLLILSIGNEFAKSVWGIGLIPPFAFFGAIVTVLIVYRIARVRNHVPVIALLLSGVVLSSILSAFLSLMIYFSEDLVHPLIYWLMGSLNNRGWQHVLVILPYPLFGLIYLLAKSNVLDMFAVGEEKAQQLGVSVEKEKLIFLIVSSILTGAAVAVSGVIGFVGLVIPHIIRLIFGPNHFQLIFRSAIWGGCFMIIADTLARSIMNVEIPVGIITSLCGGPFFIYLLKKEQNKYWGGSYE